MPVSYTTAVERLYALGHELASTPSPKFDLAHMRVLLAALGNPQRRFPSVLIAGTNGKGSTAATLASIGHAAGYRTGLYTSPHLLRINERLRIDGDEIGDTELAEVYDQVEQAAARLLKNGDLPWHPSFFEMLTAMAFEHFARSGVDLAVLEVGMGGRLDATNVVEPCLSVITDISLDHQRFLGNTITEIASEKAGIIRRSGIVVTLPQHPEANDVIGNAILACNAHAVNAAKYVPPLSPKVSEDRVGAGLRPVLAERSSALSRDHLVRNRYPLTILGEEILIDSPLLGRHQLRNVALAIAAAVELNNCGFGITARDIERGIRQTSWPGRFQRLAPTGEFPECILDVAHNPAGAWALRSTLSEWYPGRPLLIVFGALRDKAISEMAQILFPLAGLVIATRAENPRAATPEEIAFAGEPTGAHILCEPTVSAALDHGRTLASPETLVVITGSIYVVGEALRLLTSGPARAA